MASVWRRLRVWVVGANDGIIATAGLLQGFAGAGADNLLLLDLQLSTIRTFSSSGFLSASGLIVRTLAVGLGTMAVSYLAGLALLPPAD